MGIMHMRVIEDLKLSDVEAVDIHTSGGGCRPVESLLMVSAIFS